MAKFFCAYSGLECEVSHLPISLTSREYAHPVFFMQQKKLLGLYSKYQSQSLNDIDSYLLYLALFNSTDLIEFRSPALFTSKTPQIIANNIEPLCEIVFKMNTISTPTVQFPKFVVTNGTMNLENSHYWIQAWKSCYESFLNGNRIRIEQEELYKIEHRLHRLILDPNSNPTKYATVISNWAMKAADFPAEKITTDFGIITKADYWQLIIRKCVNEKAIFDIPSADINELITYCEENIEHGTIYAHSLMTLLREGKHKQINYLGLHDLDSFNTPYQILEGETPQTELANLIAIIQSAPKEFPSRLHYPTEFAFLKAKIKYQTAQRMIQDNPDLSKYLNESKEGN